MTSRAVPTWLWRKVVRQLDDAGHEDLAGDLRAESYPLAVRADIAHKTMVQGGEA